MSEKTEVIEVGTEVTEAVAKEVSKDIDAKFEELTKQLEERIAEVSKKEEEIVDKGARGAAEAEVVEGLDALTKEEFVKRQFTALVKGQTETLKEMNEHAAKSLLDAGVINKATYMNVGTDADGGYLVPNADLLSEVMEVLPEYSALAGELRVITLNEGSSLDIATLTADVVMTEVGSEGGSKADTKTTVGTKNVAVREWAGIAIVTKKLLNQSAVDIWDMLRSSFARAIAKKREELALTDSTVGITNDAGVVEYQLAATNTSYTDVTWSDMKKLPYQVPTDSANGGIYVVSRLLLGHLDSLSDTTGQDIVTVDGTNGAGQLTGRFKNGFRFVVAETLGTADAVDTPFAVFGNFSRYGVVLRQGQVDMSIFDSGVVNDGTTDHNLINENKMAMRVETWENVGYPLPGAFVMLTTAAA